MDQKVKVFFVPKRHADRVALNKKLRDEQKPSLKNTLKKIAKKAVKVAGTVHRVSSKKLDNFIADNKKINRIESDLFGEMDKGLKSMGSSAKNSWVHSSKSSKATEPVKKKKTKKVK